MPHAIILLKQLISELQASTTNPNQQNLIGDLWPAAEALDAKIKHGDPHSAEIEAVLDNLEAWLQTANVTASAFDVELNHHIAAMAEYLP